MTSRTPAWVWIVVIGATIAVSSTFMYLVTTFLFAFSGGQYRMVAVVNIAALVMIAVAVVASVVAWRIRSAVVAAMTATVVCGAGWIATAIIEWVLSFWLGA